MFHFGQPQDRTRMETVMAEGELKSGTGGWPKPHTFDPSLIRACDPGLRRGFGTLAAGDF